MTEDERRIVPQETDRESLGCRVSQDTQDRFGSFVTEHVANRRGAYGYAVERAMEEYMDNDRYAKIETRLDEVEAKVKETNALVRQLITAEKEKGAFLEPGGPQSGSRKHREDLVIEAIMTAAVDGDESFDNSPYNTPELSESTLNKYIVEGAGVSSEPSKRDYRESLIERELLEPVGFERFALTTEAVEQAGYTLNT